jgi:cystathionine beta-lyase/cystathionine gamma-synthase
MTKDRHDHPLQRETIAASHGVATDPAFGAVAPPLYLSTTYEFAGFDQARQYDYGARAIRRATSCAMPWPGWKAGPGRW